MALIVASYVKIYSCIVSYIIPTKLRIIYVCCCIHELLISCARSYANFKEATFVAAIKQIKQRNVESHVGSRPKIDKSNVMNVSVLVVERSYV